MILDKELHIRLMNYGDFDLMVKWLNDQRVLEFYEEPPSNLDRVINKYGPRIEGKHYVTPCIVEYNNESIGYIQYYEIQETELKKYGYLENHNIYGLDQFIGEPELWGKGLGTKMIQMMLDFLWMKGASKVLLEVKSSNVRAISSYKKCGFKRIKDLNNNLLLMEWKAK
ncbi:GNAT family N-acetyltransferase [Ureibacillus sinduriensis]|uniref:GCN5 family acetyltransferase n=1 Tax=Ureibacillus sinduriensis BLB-1 = JCM 15800 TaxID=1384057 RepID=A0A0A3I1X2_9BACL|nr:GNAT family N-acetyltransferase [Ureibacillus sinduriensis]KGR78786.1 GCN5 family acetyltransferase [Ureibacillus sinduriensis BLB-1 = JCM 15800]